MLHHDEYDQVKDYNEFIILECVWIPLILLKTENTVAK